MASFPGVFGTSRLRMKPLMIILAAVSLGLIFLGIVLTIVGFWPGYTAWGGNPLKYAGPILLGIGIVILVGVVADCCVRQEQDSSYEKQEFADMYSAGSKSGTATPVTSTPTVIIQNEEIKVKRTPPASAFRPITSDNGYYPEVNVLTQMKQSPTRERKYGGHYNNGGGIPTKDLSAEPAKKTVGYNAYAYSSDGNRMKVSSESGVPPAVPPGQKSIEQVRYEQGQKAALYKPPYQPPQQPQQPVPLEGPRKWGSTEKILGENGSQAPPRSTKSQKYSSDPSKGLQPEKSFGSGLKHKLPTLQMPNIGRKSKTKSTKDGADPNAPGSPSKVRRSHPIETKARSNAEPGSPSWGGHAKQGNQGSAPNKGSTWGSRSNPTANMEGNGRDMRREADPHNRQTAESTPRDVNSSREYNSSRDQSREYHDKYKFSDPQGHTSRRERGRQQSRSRDSSGHRDRSSSGHRRNPSSSRHRSRSRDRDSRARTRDDLYSSTSIDYVTGATIRSDGRRKSGRSRDRSKDRSQRSRSHERSYSNERSHGRSYDSEEHYRKHHRYPYENQSSTSGSSRRDRRHQGGVVNPAYDRDFSGEDMLSDDSQGLSPKHRPHYSNNLTGSSEDFLKNQRELGALTPSNKKQTMNFTINVNAQPGAAVQIALGNQQLPPARPMLPGNVTLTQTQPDNPDQVITTRIPHDDSTDTQSSRSRTIRT